MRTISAIAEEILQTWKNPNIHAKPYLNAMLYLGTGKDSYGLDSATDIVLRFLCNASGFRGADARRLKAELKQAIGVK